ncbi:MAG: aldo/keto reductase [Phycisphaerales bacterium]|nr:aldo/keto reductase [Phycisphaerales bacterium]
MISPSELRPLGRTGMSVSVMALGCMGMSDFYGLPDDDESIRTFHRAADLGVNFFDTADVYGPHTNEALVGRALASLPGGTAAREKLVIATKFGLIRDPATKKWLGSRGDAAYVKACCEASLQRLGVPCIDLYYQHRLDLATPIEETVGAMADLVRAGKVRALGLSEVGPDTLRRACAVHPISALQSEYSLWTRDPEGGILDACAKLGVTFVAYSPLGRGMLTGAVTTNQFAPGDARLAHPRFQGENFDRNLRVAQAVEAMARAKGCSAAQLALAWVLAQGAWADLRPGAPEVVALFGTKRRRWLEENLAALGVHLSPADLATINHQFPPNIALGTRYPEARMAELGR